MCLLIKMFLIYYIVLIIDYYLATLEADLRLSPFTRPK